MRRAVLAVLLVVLVAPGAAHAAWFGAQAIDGPPAPVVGLGGVDVARDGTGALVYLRADAGAPHVFLSRLVGGAWQSPQRIDRAIPAPATAARVAAADGGVLIVAWAAGGTVYGMQAPSLGQLGPPVALGAGSTVDADIGVDGAGWVVWGGGGDVHAASVRAGQWAVMPSPLDVAPADDAGGPAGPPRVAVGADGSGLMTWAERAGAGLVHVYARRLTPRMSIPTSDLGAPAAQPDVDVEDDPNFGWVSFVQTGGVSHTLARHLLGSTFDPPVALDAGAPSLTPSLDMTAGGEGQAVMAGAGNSVLWSQLANDAFRAPVRIDAGGSLAAPGPLAAISEHGDMTVAWLSAPAGAPAGVHGRYKAAGRPFGPEATLTAPASGAVAPGGYDLSTDRVGDTVVGIAQGPDGARTVGAAVWDRPPGHPVTRAVRSLAARGRPRFRWSGGLELWGRQTFQVLLDGRVVGTTTASSLVPARRLPGGRHRWRVVAVDRRGQRSPSSARTLVLPSSGLRVSVRVSGSRRAGRRLRIVVRVRARPGARLRRVTVDYGDGTRATSRRVSTHRYRRAGTYTLVARAFEASGNLAEKVVRLRIR